MINQDNIHWQCSEKAGHVLSSYLRAPEFDSPVKRRGDEEVGEVYWAHSTMTADASHWSLMALEHLTDTSFTASHTALQSLQSCVM